MMKRKKQLMMEKLSKGFDGGAFDRLFWKRAGAQMRFIAAWSMLEDFYKIRGIHGYKNKLRLRRHVQSIEQIQG